MEAVGAISVFSSGWFGIAEVRVLYHIGTQAWGVSSGDCLVSCTVHSRLSVVSAGLVLLGAVFCAFAELPPSMDDLGIQGS